MSLLVVLTWSAPAILLTSQHVPNVSICCLNMERVRHFAVSYVALSSPSSSPQWRLQWFNLLWKWPVLQISAHRPFSLQIHEAHLPTYPPRSVISPWSAERSSAVTPSIKSSDAGESGRDLSGSLSILSWPGDKGLWRTLGGR